MSRQKIPAKEIHCEIIINGKKNSDGPLAYFRTLNMGEFASWIWRTCSGCNTIEFNLKDMTATVTYDMNRVEKYTIRDVMVASSNMSK